LVVVALAAMLLAVGGGLFLFDRLSRTPETVIAGGKELARGLEEIARAFTTGTVTTSFVGYATSVSGTTFLQFATLDQMEVFERTDRATTLWGQLDLPDVVVEARAPVTYTYYVDLDEEWNLELDGDRVQVTAPPIRFNKPAIDASAIDYRVRADSVLRDEEAALAALRRGLQEMAAQRARHNFPLVRELGRRRVADFVEGWLLHRFGEPSEQLRIEVTFADEPPAGRLRPPPGEAGEGPTLPAAPERP
jgi:hypothetical protein